jgi:hypothetical protein
MSKATGRAIAIQRAKVTSTPLSNATGAVSAVRQLARSAPLQPVGSHVIEVVEAEIRQADQEWHHAG